MNDLKIEKLQSLLHDEMLLGIIEEVFTATMESSKPIIQQENDDLLVGQKYRAYVMAREILSKSFRNLISYRKEKTDKKDFDKSK